MKAKTIWWRNIKREKKGITAFAHVKSNRGHFFPLESYYFDESVVLRNKCEHDGKENCKYFLILWLYKLHFFSE